MGSIEENEIHSLRNMDEKRLYGASTKVDTMFKKVVLNKITTINEVMYCGGIISSESLVVKIVWVSKIII